MSERVCAALTVSLIDPCFCSTSDVYIGYLPLAHVLELAAGKSVFGFQS